MLTETGQVVTLEGQYAMIDVQRKSSCQSCAVKSGCGTSVLAGFFAKRFSHVKALNEAQAVAGDMVELELNESALVYMTFWTYLFPILFMFAVILLATGFDLDSSVVSIVAVIGLFVGIYFSKAIIRGRLDSRQLHPVIRRVIKS